MEKLTLTPNRPEVIALAFTTGKPVQSNFGGPQVMFSLTDGRRFFADPAAAEAIDQLSLGKDEPFALTKCVDRAKNVSYDARYVQESPAPMPATFAAPIAPQPPVRMRVETPANGTTGQVVQVPAQYNAPSPQSTGGALMGCFMSAIDAIVEAAAYAERRGLDITFTAEDVRSTAISAYINLQKGGR